MQFAMRTVRRIVLPLNPLNLGNYAGFIELAFRQYNLEQLARLRDSKGWRLHSHLHAQFDQDVMCQQGHRRVVVPAGLATHFIVVQTQLAFAFFNDGLDRPTPRGQARQGFARRGLGRIAAIELPRI
jgi:hypothetical protein